MFCLSRAYEAGIFAVQHDMSFVVTIPPNTKEFVVGGHCSPECAKEKFPPHGIYLSSLILHSHLSGRKLKLRHFRDGVELPWIAYDDTFDFNHQLNKHLEKPVQVLPGDQLTYGIQLY